MSAGATNHAHLPASPMTQTTYRNALEGGTRLLEYRLEAVLGAGGFGMTYLARDVNLDRPVAIKEYLPVDLALRAVDGTVVPVSSDAEPDYRWGLERFLREARVLARFSHPNIVRVNRYFEANGTGYMVMEYEEGESLAQRLSRGSPLPEGALAALIAPLLDGLAAVHAAGFLHRDIKPSNIFIRRNGVPVLLDFGSARRASAGTRSLTAVLTPGYAPLEQYSSDSRQGPWSDVYAMGAVLYRVIVDASPPDAVTRIRGDTVMQTLDAARARYGDALVEAVKWSMALDEKARPQTVEAWRKALVPALTGAGRPQAGERTIAVASAADTARTKQLHAVKPARPSPAWRWVGRGALLAIIIGVAMSWSERRTEHEVAAPATQRTASEPAASPRFAEQRSPISTVAGVGKETRKEQDAAKLIPPDAGRERPSREREARPTEATAERQLQLRRRAASEFRSADTDGDGFLSRGEVSGRFPFIDREFARVDADRDGRISPQEFWRLRELQADHGVRP